MKLILLRHVESEWNLLNTFTGWTDVDLTENGINEAKFAGEQLVKEKISINGTTKCISKYSNQLGDSKL